MGNHRMIFLEFNELCPALLEKWMSDGHLPHFKQFYNSSDVYITEADEKKAPYLEPWIQWYSMHTGLSFQQHKVYHLTDGPKANHPDVWRILLANGKAVANCSSMNAKRFDAPGSFFLPDPWCTTEGPYPAELKAYHSVIAHTVQEYTNKDQSLSRTDYLRFLKFLLAHGLRLKTAIAVVRQMVLDQVLDKKEAWRRVVLLDKLQFDVFRYYFRKCKPDFATFFLNSTAHYQHSYWRHMAPEEFSATRPSAEEQRRYQNAILFGYQQMDLLLKDFFTLESSDVTLVLATALSQQPFLRAEATGGQHFYRPRAIETMLHSMGIAPEKILPVMTHQYLAVFGDQAKVEAARKQLSSMRVNGEEIFEFAPSNPGSLYFGCQIHSVLPPDSVVTFADGNAPPFFDLFYAFSEVKSGCHHPDGVLWIKSGRHRLHSEKLSILEVLPMILDHFGIQNQDRAGIEAARVLQHG